MTTLLLALLLLAPPDPTGHPPAIQVVVGADKETTFMVEFPKGAADACTWFVSEKETIVRDGETVPYSPTHCWLMDEDVQEFDDDWAFIKPNGGKWDVFVRIYYLLPNGNVQMLETNHVTVVH